MEGGPLAAKASVSRVGRTRVVAAFASTFCLASCATPATPGRDRMISGMRMMAKEVPALSADPVFAAALAAEARLPREDFVPKAARPLVYLGTPLEIGWDQTISDPWIMAVMTAAVRARPGAKVLEIGTGSGYQAAVLAEMGARVWSIEIVPQLARKAARTLRSRGYRDVTVRAGDGYGGWPEQAPFDAVMVTAGSAKVAPALLDQLRVGGRLVMPIGPSTPTERLEVYTKRADGGFDACSLGIAMFVPLTGRGQTPERQGIGDHSKPWCYGEPVT